MDKLKSPGKPFEISKWEVWEAYRQVKANQGAPGIDGVTLDAFEADLKNNLYRIWNRMSSGSYFPPPVRAVEIPKPHGTGTRLLGVPTVADRIAQTVVARRLEAKVEPIFHPDSYGYRPNRSALDAVAACRQRCWKTDWVIDLDVDGSSTASLGARRQGGDGTHHRPVGSAVRQAVAGCAAGAAQRELATARPRHSAGVCGLARAGEPVPALRVRRLDGSGAPGCSV
jgi:Retron-type reverse transcriptase